MTADKTRLEALRGLVDERTRRERLQDAIVRAVLALGRLLSRLRRKP